jgi:beta-glucanase (GH16 family)
MNRIGFLIIILILIRIPARSQDTCFYLVWQDDFEYTGAPDNEKWGYDTGGHGWGNQELQFYSNTRTNSYVEDGKLTIKARKLGDQWTSARLVTKGKGDWLYGRIEVKAKLPEGRGTWPAIWMLPTDWAYGGWPKSGEIDIMEHVGYDFGTVHGTIHTEAFNHSIGTQLGKSIDVENVSTEFHVYAIDWTEEEIVWYVDGEEYYRIENPKKSYKEWPFDKRFHLILNIAIGGTWGGAQGIDPNLNEATMEVDYVRVYKKKTSVGLTYKPTNQPKLKVWPNPFQDKIQIYSSKPLTGIEIFDMSGKLLLIKPLHNLYTAALDLNENPSASILKVSYENGTSKSIVLLKKQ